MLTIMSLVAAYGSSDDSESGSDSEPEAEKISDVPKVSDERPDNQTLFSCLPQPKSVNKSFSSLTNKKTVKISIPSLSEFKDEEDSVPNNKIKPSSSGSGLFALLPPPKNLNVKEPNRSFVPNVLKKPKTETGVTINKLKPIIPKSNPDVNKKDDSDNSDDESDATDFFRLNEKPNKIELETSYDSNSVQIHSQEFENVREETELEPLPPAYTTVENSTSDFIPFSSDELKLDDEAIQKLCGKRRKKDVQFDLIDVSGEEIMPDSKEWMVKQLTEQKPMKSHRKIGGPSSMQKRKHQITYLAYQAKEQELELQNQWANNRLSKRQTQSKYGF